MLRNKEIKRLVIILSVVCGLFSICCFLFNITAGLISIAALIAPFTIFFVFTRLRYKNITKLSHILSRIVSGDHSLEVRDNEEGELSVLRNEIYKAASKLTEQAGMLEKDKALLADNLSNISHQLKTPLTQLTIMCELLEDDSLPLEKRREFNANIRTGLFRLEWLALSLLKIAKLDAGASAIQQQIISVEDIVRISIQQLDIILSLKNQRVETQGCNNVMVKCDVDWTVEALSNIIKNASEYSPVSGVINIVWDENPLSVNITVSDSGGGIDEHDLPHLFKRFYKGRLASKESTGIGLALALEIMRKQSGDIEIRNNPGIGAEFTIKFYK